MKRIISIALIVLLGGAASSTAEDAAEQSGEKTKKGILDVSFLGLHLGCSKKEFTAVIKKELKEHPKRGLEFIEKHSKHYGLVTEFKYRGNHRLKGAATTMFRFFQGRLFEVKITFKENLRQTYDILKRLAEKKYGKVHMDPSLLELPMIKKIHTKKINHMEIDITLLEVRKIMGPTEKKTVITATHLPLSSKLEDAQKKKAEEEMGDL